MGQNNTHYTTTTEKIFFWKLRWASQARDKYKNPYQNQGSHVYHRVLSLCGPDFFGKAKFLTEARWCMALGDWC